MSVIDAYKLDTCETLNDWIRELESYRTLFGGESTLRATAGHNNVSFDLTPEIRLTPEKRSHRRKNES